MYSTVSVSPLYSKLLYKIHYDVAELRFWRISNITSTAQACQESGIKYQTLASSYFILILYMQILSVAKSFCSSLYFVQNRTESKNRSIEWVIVCFAGKLGSILNPCLGEKSTLA